MLLRRDVLSGKLKPPKGGKPNSGTIMDTQAIAEAWVKGKRARNKNFVTRDGRIWSYNVLIGKTLQDGTLLIYDYTNSAGNFISNTTTYHVSAIIKEAWTNACSDQKIIITDRVPYKPKTQIQTTT